MKTLKGQCTCGQLQYTVADEFRYALNCHCSQCRRSTGSAFKPFAGIEYDKLQLTQGTNNILFVGNKDQGNHDVRCATCGSLLYSVVQDGKMVHVTFGTLTDKPLIRPSAHIFVGSKAPWYTIFDDLPQHEEFP